MSEPDPVRHVISRRKLLVSTAYAGGVAAFLAACGANVGGSSSSSPTVTGSTGGSASPSPTRTPQATGKVVLYNYAEYVDPKTYDAFAAQYPKAEVVKAFYASEEEVSAKLRAGGAGQYDNVVVAGTTAAQLYSDGLLARVDHGLLPNLAGVDPGLIDQVYDPGAVFSIPKNYGATGFGYDSSKVTNPPQTWKDFYDQLEKYAPNTLLLEGATAVVGSALQALGYNLGESDDGKIAAALDLLKSKKQFIGNVSTANFYTLFGKGGPVVLGMAWNGDILRLRTDRPSLEFVVPQGPADAWTGVWAIPANAPNPEGSHAWINSLLDPQNAAREMQWSLFPVSVPAASDQVKKTNPAFDVDWITLSTADLQRLSTPVLPPDVLRKYNDAYTQFQAA